MRQNKGDHYLPIRRYFLRFVRCVVVGASCGTLSFESMTTKEERIADELKKLYDMRRTALLKNDFVWLSMNYAKIKEKENELEEARMRRPMKLLDILNDKGEDVKNRVYKSLIKISLAADFVNDCAEDAKSLLKELGLNDFTLRAEAQELCKLSQKIASFVITPNQHVLTDMIVDNDKFIAQCHKAADSHLKKTLKL